MTRLLSMILLLSAALPLRAQETGFDEYQVKAAFLYNFAKFVEWPQGTFANAHDPIGICIVGQSPFGLALDDMVRGKKIGDRAFAVRSVADSQQASRCQIMFIGASERKRTRALLEELKGAAILTVGETDDFTDLGGVIGFKLEGTRVRIQVAVDVADHTRLHISSKLLSLAEIVKRQP
jgi:YfiR/HmsC-like